MEHFFIVTNDGKDKGQKVTGEVIRILEASKKRCTRCLKDDFVMEEIFQYLELIWVRWDILPR